MTCCSIRYKEYFRDFKHANGKFKFTQNLLHCEHSIGPTESIIEVLQIVKKSGLMNTLEKNSINTIPRHQTINKHTQY